jgi:hypothetical protein
MKRRPSSLDPFPPRTGSEPTPGVHSSAQPKRLCPADTSIKIPANEWFSRFAPCRKEFPRPETVSFGEPFTDIADHGFEMNPLLRGGLAPSLARSRTRWEDGRRGCAPSGIAWRFWSWPCRSYLPNAKSTFGFTCKTKCKHAPSPCEVREGRNHPPSEARFLTRNPSCF